jgi:hypothetical protein
LVIESRQHYRKLRLWRGFSSLPRAFYRALGTEYLCQAPRSAQKYSRNCHLCRGSARRQAGTLGIIKSLSRTSSRHETHRHIWVAVHCADGCAVGPSAQMPPGPSTAAQLSAKPLTDGHRQLSEKASKCHTLKFPNFRM